jgi:hypothetical protein
MSMGTGGIPTTDNIPEKNEIFGCPTDNVPETTEIFGFPTDNIPETTEKLGCPTDNFGCLGYIVSCGYPTRTHTHTRENSVAHV